MPLSPLSTDAELQAFLSQNTPPGTLAPHSSDEQLKAFLSVSGAPAKAPESQPPKTDTQMQAPDGRVYQVPPSSYKAALQNGWKEVSADDLKAQSHEKAVQERVNWGEEHRVTEGLARFGNEALLGIPNLIKDYSAETPEEKEDRAVEREAQERLEKAHPVESMLEKGAGFVAPMLIPGVGELGDAAKIAVEGGMDVAERSLARKVAGSAAKYATEAAAYSAPTAAVQAAYGDPEKAAETMLWGIGLGGALGAGGKLAGEGVKAGGAAIMDRLLGVQSNGLTLADDIGRNVLGISDKQAKKLGATQLAKIVNRADEEGILSASPGKHAKMVDAMISDSGDKIGEHLDALEKMIPDSEQKLPSAMDVATEFDKALQNKFPHLKSELHASTKAYADDINKLMVEGGNEPSIKTLQDIRTAIGKKQKDFLANTANAEVGRLADNILKKNIELSAQMLFDEANMPEKMADYLLQKDRFYTASQLQKVMNPYKSTGRLPKFGLGGLFGLEIGAAGHPATAAAMFAYKALAENKGGLLGKSASFLRRLKNDPAAVPFLGGLMAKMGADSADEHIASIPQILSGAKVVGFSVAAANPFAHMLGHSGVGLTKEQQYDKLTAAVTQAVADTQHTANLVGGVAQPFTSTSVQLGALIAQKKLGALSYLQSQIPKGPPQAAFSDNDWKPTKAQQQDFLNKVAIVADPMVVWKHYQDGTLTATDRDVLQTVYPKLYQEMAQKIMVAAYDPKGPKLTDAQKVQLSIFTGQPLSKSLANIGSIQQAIAPVPAAQPQPQQNPKHAQRGSMHPKLERSSGNLITEAQRLTYKTRP